MKKAFFFALFGAFLVLAWTQPALAVRTVVVQNFTHKPVHVDIIYHTALCKDDRFFLGAGAVRSIYIGICLIKSFTARIQDPAGKDQTCRPHSVAGTDYRIVINKDQAQGYCAVVAR